MEILIEVRKNAYYDSVTLMTLTNRIKKAPGVAEAVIAMGTDMNREQLASVGLLNTEAGEATAADLIIAIKADTVSNCEAAHSGIDELMSSTVAKKGRAQESYPTIQAAKKEDSGFNLAVISVSGEHAAREADIALKNDMHVMLFSDNVTEDEEVYLKRLAHEKGLLMMGPDCGTAMVNGVGLCFANAVRRGDIGIVAASGTGLQEVMVLIDSLGGGVSEAIGTGGRDLSAAVGGIMMLDGMELLGKDPTTKVIVLVSKPPVKEVAERILDRVAECKKPVVVCFIGGDKALLSGSGAIFAGNLEHAARQAVRAANGDDLEEVLGTQFNMPTDKIREAIERLAPQQKYIRGLFCGGTLAAEAASELGKQTEEYYSNVEKRAEHKMQNPMKSMLHSIVDLGDDMFTVGRPHPMIEPELRLERLLEEADDPETAVLLLDFELGFGSNADPVGCTIDAVKRIRREKPEIAIVAYILGTAGDWQGFTRQRELLLSEGVIVASSNLHAVKIAMNIAFRKGE